MNAIKQWWQQRLQREQNVLIVGVIASILLLLYAFLWQPLQQQQQQLRVQVKAQSSLYQWMQQAAQQANYLKTRRLMQQTPQASLLSLLDKSLNNSPLQSIDKRISPKDEQQVYIQFDQVDFDGLLQWLAVLANQYAIEANEVHISRLESAGQVKAQIKLFRAMATPAS